MQEVRPEKVFLALLSGISVPGSRPFEYPLDQARDARLAILKAMTEVIPKPREEMNQWAPRIESVEIPKDKIGEIIGPKGAVIRELEEVTGAKIEIEEGDYLLSIDGHQLQPNENFYQFLKFYLWLPT